MRFGLRRLLLAVAALAAAFLADAPAFATGFDCAKAWSADEQRICASPELSRLDDQLNQAYRSALDATYADARKALITAQRDWLKRRRSDCTDDAGKANDECLAGLYRDRLAELAAAGAYDSGASHAPGTASELAVSRLTPDGEDVPAGRQIVLQFNQDMVPVGDMRRAAASLPVQVTPALNCEWRWLNASALACQLDEQSAMKPATRYRVEVRPGLRSLSGATMVQTWTGGFVTRRPTVSWAGLVFWLTPQRPIIRVTFAVPVTKTSVARSLAFTEGDHPPFAFDVYPDDLKRQFPEWMTYLGLDEGQPEVARDDFIAVGKDEARSIWLLVPKGDLPADSNISLDVAPGLVTPLGPEVGAEETTVVTFATFGSFRFLGIRCMPNEPNPANEQWEDYDVASLSDAARLPKCDPLAPVMLRFSSPVKASEVKAHVAFTPRLDGGRTDYDPWANAEDYTQRTEAHQRGHEYSVWLPELLKAAEGYRIDLGSALRDEFGRPLETPLSARFDTTHRDPRLVIDYNDIVLEKGVNSQAAGYVTNIDRLHYAGTRLDAASVAHPVALDQPMANVEDISYKFALMVRDVLQGESGAAWFCVSATPPSVQRSWRNNCVFAQVTPWQVHAKLGHFSSLVWVTDLATGAPVKGASVDIVVGRRDSLGAAPPVGPAAMTTTVVTDAQGIAELPGIESIDPALNYLGYGWNSDRKNLFVRVSNARAGGRDLALLPLDSAFAAQPGNGIWASLQKKGQHAQAWGFTAQGVYRGGDTVDAKIYVRDQTNRHWQAPALQFGYTLRVLDPTGTEVYSREGIELDDVGSQELKFALQPQAVAGWYDVQLRSTDGQQWTPMRFLVSDFTPAPFRTESELAGDQFGPGDKIAVTTRATLYSGGAFANADARVTARIEGLPYTPGTTVTRGYQFGSWDGSQTGQRELGQQQGRVDAGGLYRTQFAAGDDGIYYGRVLVESAVIDDRGKYVSATSSALYVSRDRFVGIHPRDWLFNANQDGMVDLVVADPRGKLVGDTDVDLALEKRVIRTARVQGPGDAYLLRNTGDWEAVSHCSVRSSAEGRVTCTIHPAEPGSYRLVANIKDTKGRAYRSEDSIWVVGPGWVNWANDNDGGLEIVPENDTVQVGGTARYLVKNPYPGARALITIERYGVLEHRVQVLNDASSVIEVPVTADMKPGFFLSVLVSSPRVDKPLDGEVDLGKPAFRMGYVKTMVKAPEKRLQIQVTPARAEYRPRDNVVAHLKVSSPSPKKQGASPQLGVAVVAIDEAVLALNAAGAKYYDPDTGFNRLDALDVANWDLVTRLVGRQKIEKKGANPGGDGGKTESAFSTLRDQFRYVALWSGDVKLDARGEADVHFQAPDNLTGWRLLAIGVTRDDAFGLGEATVKVNRPTEIRPAMPNQVTEGDSFTARFTVMNRTKQARDLAVRVVATCADVQPFQSTLHLAPYEQKIVQLPVTTRAAGTISFKASAGDALDSDALASAVPVKVRRTKEVAANYGTTVDAQAVDAVSIPKAIYPDASALSVTLAPTVLGNLDGAYRYVADYPYLCWEQRLDKALMYATSKTLRPWLKAGDLPQDPDALVRDMLASAAGFQAPGGGMAFWNPQDAYVSPYLSAYTALAFRWLARSGYAIPKDVDARLQDYLRTMLRTDVMPTFYDPGMSSTVRAVALAALADSGAIGRDEVARYASHVPRMSLLGKAAYLQAAVTAGAPAQDVQDTTNAILAMANQTGGKFQFLERLDDGYSELLATPLRDNCAVLSAMLRASTSPAVAAKVRDVPFKLVRMITQSRGNRDHFENTQENVFCTNALIDYARIYERDKPAMTVTARLDAEPIGKAAFNSVQDPMQVLRRPLTATDPGRSAHVILDRSGSGRLYYSTRLEFAPRDEAATSANNGITVTREYSVQRDGKWRLVKNGETLRRSDLVRVDLFVNAPAARHFVVVDDPVPGLLEPVNTALATESTVDDRAATWDGDAHSYWFSNRDGWETFGRYGYSFYHREIRHDAVRFYSDLLPAGNYHLAYTAQVIATGEFAAQPTFAGEMYDIDVFGRGLPTRFRAADE